MENQQGPQPIRCKGTQQPDPISGPAASISILSVGLSRRSSTPLTGFSPRSGRVQGRRGAAGRRGDRRRPAQGVRGPEKDRLHLALPQ